MDEKHSFAKMYGIDSIDYIEVQTESVDFPVCTFGRFRANKIYRIIA